MMKNNDIYNYFLSVLYTSVRDKINQKSLTENTDSQINVYSSKHREGKAFKDGTDA